MHSIEPAPVTESQISILIGLTRSPLLLGARIVLVTIQLHSQESAPLCLALRRQPHMPFDAVCGIACLKASFILTSVLANAVGMIVLFKIDEKEDTRRTRETGSE